MNIFEAAREAFPNQKAIAMTDFPDVVIQDDAESCFLVTVDEEGTAFVGWNPTAQQLAEGEWMVREQIEIKRRVYPWSKMKTARACGFEDDAKEGLSE